MFIYHKIEQSFYSINVEKYDVVTHSWQRRKVLKRFNKKSGDHSDDDTPLNPIARLWSRGWSGNGDITVHEYVTNMHEMPLFFAGGNGAVFHLEIEPQVKANVTK